MTQIRLALMLYFFMVAYKAACQTLSELQELRHEMDRYRWNILATAEEGHKVFFSGKEDKDEHGVQFLVHKDVMNTVMGCCRVSSRLITIFNSSHN